MDPFSVFCFCARAHECVHVLSGFRRRGSVAALVAAALLLAIPAVLLLSAAPAPASAAPSLSVPETSATGWVRPVPGPVLREFEPPASVYGAGHRGVDFAAATGTTVRAAGPGRVEFAGNVAGGLHVTVLHGNGLRTSYSFLGRVDVAKGDVVDAGAVIGVSGARGHDRSPLLHMGLRSGDVYLDPMMLFATRVPADVVRLIPNEDPGDPAGRSATRVRQPEPPDLPDAPELPGPPRLPDPPVLPVPEIPDAPDLPEIDADDLPVWIVSDALDGGPSFARRVGDVGGGVARWSVNGVTAVGGGGLDLAWSLAGRADDLALDLATDLAVDAATRTLAPTLPALPFLEGGVALGRDVARGSARGLWNFTTGECTRDAPHADGTGGSGNAVTVVAGVNSSLSEGGTSVGIPTDLIGYEDADVAFFDYSGADSDGAGYAASDTWIDPFVAAERLGEQLRRRAVDDPDRPIDLLAHSLGGVVVRAFLQLVYDEKDPAYPPLGRVVTLSSPLSGAPAATAGRDLASGPLAPVATTLVGDGSLFPPLDAPVTEQLAEGSELMRRLEQSRLPEGLEIRSIGAFDDFIVPADSISAPGTTDVVVNPPGFSDHSAIVSDPGALREVRLALEGRPPACRSLLSHLRGEVEPVVISGVEHELGAVGGAPFGGELP